MNHVVGVDLVILKNLRGEEVPWINCVCWGSSFQLVGPSKDKTAEEVWAAFVRVWVRIFGMPEVLVCDPGP